ncbi:MAG: hypothetical protein L0191_08955, partial [Acidobacteria bacterium]|nr:hypothetical protein [Acidobacteriota bacterium]
EVSRRIKQDRLKGEGDRGDTVRYLREIRKGERAYEAAAVERAVLRQTRVALPYSRLVVDFAEGRFCYREPCE